MTDAELMDLRDKVVAIAVTALTVGGQQGSGWANPELIKAKDYILEILQKVNATGSRDLAAMARDGERKRCIDIAMAQYVYWRDAECEVQDQEVSNILRSMHCGSMGAAANILGAIALGGRKLHPEIADEC